MDTFDMNDESVINKKMRAELRSIRIQSRQIPKEFFDRDRYFNEETLKEMFDFMDEYRG